MVTSLTGTIIIMVITAHGIHTGMLTGTITITTSIVHTPIQFTSIVKAERTEIPIQDLKPGSKVRLITLNDIRKTGIVRIRETRE